MNTEILSDRTVLKDYEVPSLVARLSFESGKTLFAIAEEAGLGANTAYNWSRGMTVPRLPQFLWFLDAVGYRLVLEKKEGTE